VRVDARAFEASLAQLVLDLPLSLRPSQAGRLLRASSYGATLDGVWQGALRRDYGHWCGAHEAPGDCLSLLEDGLGLEAPDRLTVALALAYEPLRESIADAVEDTLNPQFFTAVVMTSLASWVALAAAPEPVFTKAAAVLSAVLLAYLGEELFLKLVRACFVLKEATARATTFRQLDEAGARFGRVLGTEGARLFILAVTVLVSQGTAQGTAWLASRLALLPSFAEAAALGASQVGLRLEAVGQVRAVAVVQGRLAITLSPSAVAMAAMGPDERTEDHHLATIRNEKSAARGGPWTPRFRDLFKKAGMELKDPENVVPLKGHKGPHPQEYHQLVFRRLSEATEGCRTVQACRKALTDALQELADEAILKGTEINRLLTRGR
jgi:hypothetical protein